MKVALVHDWLNKLGGAERVLIELHKIFPDAPIYTLFYDPKFAKAFLSGADVRPSFLQKIPFINRIYKYLFFLMPSAIESLDISDFDTVISSSVFFSKGVILRPKTKHICYCYSPARQLWDRNGEYLNETGNAWPARLAQHFLRIWDKGAASRVDDFIAISEHVRSRIQKYYRRDAKVIYPSAPTLPEGSEKRPLTEDYFLIVSRLYPSKNIELAIDTFNKLGFPLVIIGQGPLKKRFKKIATKNIRITGGLSDNDMATYYRHSKAFIMPQEEDFGLTPVEAMQFGKPVLALRRGGALETVREGITGEFFDDPIPEALADGIRRLNEKYPVYDPAIIRKSSERFLGLRFREEIERLLIFR